MTEVRAPAPVGVVTCTERTQSSTRQWPVGMEKHCQFCEQGFVSGSWLCSQHLQ